jgi:citrate synthase
MVGSSHAGLFASSQEFQRCGDLHGGANQAVLEMLEEIHQNGGMLINIWQKPKIKTIPLDYGVLA